MSLAKWQTSLELYDGIEEERFEALISEYSTAMENEIVQRGIEVDVTVKRAIHARSGLLAIMSAVKDSLFVDTFILYSLNRASEEGWWQDLGVWKALRETYSIEADDEWNTFSDFVGAIYDIKAKKYGKEGGPTSDWRFIATVLVPVAKEIGITMPEFLKAIGKKYESRLRAAIPRLRTAWHQYEHHDRERGKKELKDIFSEVLEENPENRQSVGVLRSKNPHYTPPIPSQSTGMFITGSDGSGIVTVKVRNQSQALAVQKALGGLVDGKEDAFFPRDVFALAKETTEMIKRGSYEVIRDPQSEEDILKYYTVDDISKIVIPVFIDVIVACGSEQTFFQILSGLCFSGNFEEVIPVSYEIFSFQGRELHILFTFKLRGGE